MLIRSTLTFLVLVFVAGQQARADVMEIYCTIRSGGENMNCQVMGKERKVMNAEDIANFVDAGQIAAYITLKSLKGMERTFLIDPKAPQYKHLNAISKNAGISEIATAKSNLFSEIEKKVIQLSKTLDAQAANADLVLFDSSITYDKLKRESRLMMAELEGYRKNKEKTCTSTPAFESVSKANSRLQQTLSNLVFAFQTQDSCMADYKVFKDRDGSVDLRQLDTAADHFKTNCRKR